MSLRHATDSSTPQRCSITVCGPSIRAVIKIYHWTTVVELKQQIRDLCGLPTHLQTLYYHHMELSNSNPLSNFIHWDCDPKPRIVLSLKTSNSTQHIQTYPSGICESRLKSVVSEVSQAFALGLSPVLTDNGTGGAYFLRNPGKNRVAVFKPMDEEPFGPNNPREYVGQLGNIGLRSGVRSGESAYREVAAYLLDYESFAKVPPTCLAEAMHSSFCYRNSLEGKTKKGSFQSFVRNDGVAEDYSPTNFTRNEVQKIAILDIRLANLDRNEANILVVKDTKELIPIDHGLTLPDCFEITKYDLCWMSWPQTKEPLTDQAREYVARINPLEDIHLLKQCLPIGDKCLRNARISGLLLKKGVEAGLTLYEIGTIMYRNDDTSLSILEKAISNAEQIYSLVKRCNVKKVASPVKVGKARPRALSDNETELYFGDFLRRFEMSTTESDVADSPMILGAIDEEEEEEEDQDEREEDEGEALSKPIHFTHRRTRSTPVALLPALDCKTPSTEEAFDDHLFHYISAFLEQAIQRKVKETRSKFHIDDRSLDSRVRSKSLFDF